MTLLGLTGGMGAGKSTAADLLRRMGVAIADTDAVAHQLTEPGQPALAEISARFGAHLVGADGRLDRAELARIVFADPQARLELEAILHPRIRKVWEAEVAAWRAGGTPVGVVVIPLLFETGATPLFDATVCVACSRETQRRRLRQRDWTDPQIDGRLRAQWPMEEKMAATDFVVWTEAGLDVHRAQLERIIASVRPVAGD
jgi:dephospho-CoA kinase